MDSAPTTMDPSTSGTSSSSGTGTGTGTGLESSSGEPETSGSSSGVVGSSSSGGEIDTCNDGLTAAGELCLGPKAVNISRVGNTPSGIASGDLDDDGHIDLVTANVGGNDLTVLWGDGAGGMEIGPALPAGLQPRGVSIGDLDQNDVLDIAVANLQTEYVGVYLHDMDNVRTFADQVPHGTGLSSRPRHVELADINFDGEVDMVAVAEDDETVEVFVGAGLGVFLDAVEYPVGPQPYDVALADFNGDDELDAVTANFGEGSVSVLLGDGAAGFLPETRFDAPEAGGEGVRSVIVADFTGDDLMDIVVAGFAAEVVGVLPGDGKGGFARYVPFPVGDGPYAVAVADMNLDGTLDLVSVLRDTAEVSVLIVEDDGTFTDHRYSVVLNPLDLVVADFNEDLAPDIAVAGSVASAVSLVLSNP